MSDTRRFPHNWKREALSGRDVCSLCGVYRWKGFRMDESDCIEAVRCELKQAEADRDRLEALLKAAK